MTQGGRLGSRILCRPALRREWINRILGARANKVSSLASERAVAIGARGILNPISIIGDSDLAALNFNFARKWLLIIGSDGRTVARVDPDQGQGEDKL